MVPLIVLVLAFVILLRWISGPRRSQQCGFAASYCALPDVSPDRRVAHISGLEFNHQLWVPHVSFFWRRGSAPSPMSRFGTKSMPDRGPLLFADHLLP
jgi:hypothetical protein